MFSGIASALPPILGPGVVTAPACVFFDDCFEAGSSKFNTSADVGVWLNTTDNSGTVRAVDAAPNGVFRILPGTAANDFVSIQMNGEAWAVPSLNGRRLVFQTRVKTNDADDIKFNIGLNSTDVTGTTAGPVLDGTNDSIAFRNTAGNVATFGVVTEDDTTETTSLNGSLTAAGTLADDTWVVLSFEVIGHEDPAQRRVNYYVDGVKVATHVGVLPDAAAGLTLTIEVGSPTGTTATYLDVDYILCVADRVL